MTVACTYDIQWHKNEYKKKSLNNIHSQTHNLTWQVAKWVAVISEGGNDCTAGKVLSREYRCHAINLAPIPISDDEISDGKKFIIAIMCQQENITSVYKTVLTNYKLWINGH